MQIPERVYGVDFSGAKDAGRKVWIAAGIRDGTTFRLESCRPAESLPNGSRRRNNCYAALRELLVGDTNTAAGFDFPFSLPASLVNEASWEDFVLAFPMRYPDSESFRSACRTKTGGKEYKRRTDTEQQTPFSAYNLRLYKQTYFGIRDVLHPLVRDHHAWVVPMQPAKPGRPWLLEVCPASTLKQEGLYQPYKGKTRQHRAQRRRLLTSFEDRGLLSIDEDLRAKLVADADADGLDSVVAAIATARVLPELHTLTDVPARNEYALEGYVYA